MRRAGGWLLCTALASAPAWAQPTIEDPTPTDPDSDWGLQLESVDLEGAPLQAPNGLVFLGTSTRVELLVIEKGTGRVRHFADTDEDEALEELDDALDLEVDTCGERGLVGIALHPFFVRSAPEISTPDPEHPELVKQDWVYLSYHTAGAGSGDGCHGAAELRVERYTWDGTLDGGRLVDPQLAYRFPLAAGETTQLGGQIALALDVDPDSEFELIGSLFVALGALGRDGALQNDRTEVLVGGELIPDEELSSKLDDTSALLRLRDDHVPADPELGKPLGNNPFNLVRPADEEQPDLVDGAEQDYYAYGIRDPRGLAVDPSTQIFGTRLWLSERSGGGDDEIDLLESGDNGGYAPYTGFQPSVPANRLENGDENPAYPLVDLGDTTDRNEAKVPIRTYSNPPFTFEAPEVGPTGLAVGGTEAGLQHRGALFVGTDGGRLLRFAVNPTSRLSFTLGPPLSDFVANEGEPEDDPKTDPDETMPDALTQIIIATGFGAISDLETGVDGSIYVLDQANGALYRVFTDSLRDLALTSIKAPKKVGLSAKRPMVTRNLQVTIVNRGEVPERIVADRSDDPETEDVDEGVETLRDNLTALIGLEIIPEAPCAAPATRVVVPKYARPPHTPVIGIAANGGRLTVDVEVTWACAATYEVEATLDMEQIGIIETAEDPSDNACPRESAGEDPGCGSKASDRTIVTVVTQK